MNVPVNTIYSAVQLRHAVNNAAESRWTVNILLVMKWLQNNQCICSLSGLHVLVGLMSSNAILDENEIK